MFLVLNNDENRIVCDCPNRPTLYHVGTFVEGELVMDDNINIPYPKKHTFTNIDSLVSYVNDINIHHFDSDYRKIKFPKLTHKC